MKPMPRLSNTLALLLPVLLVASAGCDIAMADFREQQTEEWRKAYDFQAGGRIEISNINGKIDVSAGEGNRVEIVAKKVGRASSPEAAKEALSRIQIVDSTSGGVIKVETRADRSGGFFNHSRGQVEYTLRVPAGAELKLATVNGGVEVTGISGRVVAEATNGGVRGRDISGAFEATTTNGGVEVDLTSLAPEGIRMECTNGGISVTLPKDAKATLSARATNGGIDTDGLAVETRGESSRRRLDADLNGGGPRIQLACTNGGIEVRGR